MILDKKVATSPTEAGFNSKSKVFMSKGLIFSKNLEAKQFAESEVGKEKVLGLGKELKV